MHELTVSLLKGATVFGDKGYISDPDAASILAANGVRLISMQRKNMTPNTWADDYDLAHYRKRIETMNSQLEAMASNSFMLA